MTEPANVSDSPVLAVSATFTAEPLEESLAFWMRELGLKLAVRFAPYNQVFQQLLDPASLLAVNRNGVNVILFRPEDWARDAGSVGAFIDALRAAAAKFPSPFVVSACPPSPSHPGDAARMNGQLENAARELPSVHLATAAELNELYPVDQPHDPHGDELGHVPYTPEFFTALGTLIARKTHALRRAPYKAIVLDCDETLWSGVCGEDGPHGVVCDAGRWVLQDFMRRQREAGMLLCLASKNNEQDVVETFRANPEMPLKLDHFAARRINWEPKSANLVSLAGELNLGLDSFIFIDDNRAECAEVEANCPEVLTLPLPAEPENIPRFLKHVWAFDRPKTTAEDRARAAWYAQDAERTRLEKQAPTLADFLAALNLQIRIFQPAPDQLVRVAQLTHRTNQMNFSGVRRNEGEIRDLLRSGAECLAVDLADRFGSYGLVGVMLFSARDGRLVVDTFLLSCRALGKGVEHRMLARLGGIAIERGLAAVEVPFVHSARNRPALDFLYSAGAAFETPTEFGMLFRFPAADAAAVAYRPARSKPSPAHAPAPSHRPASDVDFVRVANELWNVNRIRERIAAGRRERPARTVSGAPRTDLERRLAEIWADLLGLPEVGIHDCFFDLGGHSLKAVELLSRVRREFGVEASLEVVYGGPFTVAELAKAIEIREIEDAGAAEYDQLLKELEGMSDDEVRALIETEEDAARNRKPD